MYSSEQYQIKNAVGVGSTMAVVRRFAYSNVLNSARTCLRALCGCILDAAEAWFAYGTWSRQSSAREAVPEYG